MSETEAAAVLAPLPIDPLDQRILLLSMLPRHIAYLGECMSRQQGYGTPEARLVADIYQNDLDATLAWLQEVKGGFVCPATDKAMSDAWDVLGREIDAQLCADMQEAVDVLTVWEYIKENGGGITRPAVMVFPVDEAAEIKRFEQFENERTNANVTAAAAWVRKQEGE